MCFTPIISLSTAIFEFIIATIILLKYKNYIVPVFSSIFIYLLGTYQFTEFMICTSNNPFLWARLGFITYTFLPTLILHFALRFLKVTKEKRYIFAIYIIPIIFSTIALMKKDFIITAFCEKVFVVVQAFFIYSPQTGFNIIYYIYYYGYFFFTLGLFVKSFTMEKNKSLKRINKVWIFAGTATTLAPTILLLVLPSLGIQFPSIYCEFAIFYTLAAYFGSTLYDKLGTKREKF